MISQRTTIAILLACLITVGSTFSARRAVAAPSSQFNITIQPVTPPPAPGGGSVGGGGVPATQSSSVTIHGWTFPSALVTILKDGQSAVNVNAVSDGSFQAVVSGLSAGSYVFGVFATDPNGNRTITQTYAIDVVSGMVSNVNGIVITPIIVAALPEFSPDGSLKLSGSAPPGGIISVIFPGENSKKYTATADEKGHYNISIPSAELPSGKYAYVVNMALRGVESPPVNIPVEVVKSDAKVGLTMKERIGRCDMSKDGRCNLTDFSVLAYWYHRSNPPKTVDLNGDGVIDLKDFSILAYYWTG